MVVSYRKRIAEIAALMVWALLLCPAIFVIYAQKTIHPKLTDVFTLSDVFYLLNEIFITPGEYFAWMLSITGLNTADSDMLKLLISTILFLPFFIWPFLRSERFAFLKKMLCMATGVFVFLCVSVSVYIFVV